MTYKSTNENAHFLKRAGSHSTKGSRRGFVDANFGNEDEFKNDPRQEKALLVQRKESLIQSVKKLEIEIFGKKVSDNFKHKLREPSYVADTARMLPKPKRQLFERYLELRKRITENDALLKNFKDSVPKLPKALRDCFFEAAQMYLSEEMFQKILAAASEMRGCEDTNELP